VGLDRTDDGDDAVPAADRPVRAVPGAEPGGEVHERDGQAAVSAGRERGAADGLHRAARETPGVQLAAEDRIAAQQHARATTDAVYAAWEQKTASVERLPARPAHLSRADGDQRNRDAEAASRGHPGGEPVAGGDSPARSPDRSPAAEDALRRRVSELEADKTARDRQLAGYETRLAAQDKTIAEQGRHIAEQDKRTARLEADLGRVAEALLELREKQDDPRPSAEIGGRFRGKESERPEWKEEQHKRRLPTDAVNNVVSAAVGSAITALPYQIHDLPPEVAGIAAGGVALGAGIIAVWRERRKAKNDADRRPEN
jgi:uncharacterized coiled-coil protein SlyX